MPNGLGFLRWLWLRDEHEAPLSPRTCSASCVPAPPRRRSVADLSSAAAHAPREERARSRATRVPRRHGERRTLAAARASVRAARCTGRPCRALAPSGLDYAATSARVRAELDASDFPTRLRVRADETTASVELGPAVVSCRVSCLRVRSRGADGGRAARHLYNPRATRDTSAVSPSWSSRAQCRRVVLGGPRSPSRALSF